MVPGKDARLAAKRQTTLRDRDRFSLPDENLRTAPTEFCAGNKCAKSYAEVASALYGPGAASGALPVFCAPKRQGGKWSKTRVRCSANWLDTLGGWKPWRADGEPSPAPEPGVLPPFACFGAPHVVRSHFVLPPG